MVTQPDFFGRGGGCAGRGWQAIGAPVLPIQEGIQTGFQYPFLSPGVGHWGVGCPCLCNTNGRGGAVGCQPRRGGVPPASGEHACTMLRAMGPFRTPWRTKGLSGASRRFTWLSGASERTTGL